MWRQDEISNLACDAQGACMASGSGDTVVRVWRLPEFATRRLEHPLANQQAGAIKDGAQRMKVGVAGIVSAAFDRDRQRILVGGVDNAVRLVDANRVECFLVLTRDSDIAQRLCLHPNRRILSIGGRDGMVRQWDLAAGGEIGLPMPHKFGIGGLAFSPDGARIATGTVEEHEPLRIWDSSLCQLLNEFGRFSGVVALSYSPGGDLLAVCDTETAFFCDPASGQARELPHGCAVLAVAFHPRDHVLVTGAKDGKLRWWSSDDQSLITTVQAHQDRINGAAFSPDGELVASLGMDRKVRFWHVTTRLPVGPPVALSDEARCVTFDPDGQSVWVGCNDGSLHRVPAPQSLKMSGSAIDQWTLAALGVELDGDGERVVDSMQ